MIVTFDIKGTAQAAKMLALMTDRAKDVRGALNKIADEFTAHERTVFIRQGAVEGLAGWAPLKPDYAAEKLASGYSGGILVRTGRLRMSLTNKNDANFVMRMTPKSLKIGTSVPYAMYHRKGTVHMPKREPIRTSPAQLLRWKEILRNFIFYAKK